MIVGIDEVGRGPWAGPVVFGAVVLGSASIEGLTDSKKLSKKRRESISREIHEKAMAVGLGWVGAEELDTHGLSWALTEACKRALAQITVPYQHIILDGTVNLLKDTGKGPYVTTMAKADLLVPSVSAASIVAKVARDQFMADQDTLYPGYGFASHAGYGTVAHREALERLGVTPLHRQSFAPIAALGHPTQAMQAIPRTSTTAIGNRAEDAAAEFLRRHGYTVVARNWKTKACEIDIIATKKDTVYFVEVKYRSRADQGGGIAAITPKKLTQMDRAARVWFQRHGERIGSLAVIEVSGDTYEVTRFLEQV